MAKLDQIAALAYKGVIKSPDLFGCDSVFMDDRLLSRFSGKIETQDGGEFISQTVTYGKNKNFRWISGSETIQSGISDKTTGLNLSWREVAGHIVIDGMTAVVKVSGKAKIINYVESEILNGKMSGAEAIHEAIVLGDGAVPPAGAYCAGGSTKEWFDGFPSIILNSTSAYAGISASELGTKKDGSTNIWAPILDTTTTTFTAKAFRAQILKQKCRGSKSTVCITTDDVESKMWSLLNASERYVKTTDDTLTKPFDISFLGIPIITSDFMVDLTGYTSTTQHCLLIDDKYFKVIMSPHRNPEIGKPLIGENADIRKIRIIYAGNIVCGVRFSTGGFTAINPAS